MFTNDILGGLEGRQFLAGVRLDALASPSVVIHLCVTDSYAHLTHHRAFTLAKL